MMHRVHSISSSNPINISIVEQFLDTGGIQHLIDAAWNDEIKRRGQHLFNGKILTAVRLHEQGMTCAIAEYRHLIAQMRHPELYAQLSIRPVAVSGLLACADGIVIGKRHDAMTQEAGLWELVPSGGIDANQPLDVHAVDFKTALLNELAEEIGMDADSIVTCQPFCLVEDEITHVIDIGVYLESSLSFAEIMQYHSSVLMKEYNEIQVISLADIDTFIQRHADNMVSVSVILLQQFFNLPA